MEPYRDLGTFDGLSGFQGAVGKMVRARYQLREFDKRFEAFTKSRAYRLSEQFEFRPGQQIGDYSFVVESVSIPKREWGVLIGELVHNLRSGLDHAVYAAAKAPSGSTEFPIFTRRSDWDKKAHDMIRSVPDEIADMIEQAQPYRAPKGTDPREHLLAILNRLSNYDKHRLLHTAVMTLEGAAPGFKMLQDVSAIHEIALGFGPLEPGETLATLTIETDGPEPKIEMYGEFAFGVAFSDPTGRKPVLEGQPVFDVLYAVYRIVTDLIIRMEIACKS